MKKKQLGPKPRQLMPLWGVDDKIQDNSAPTEKDIAEAASEMRGNRLAAGIRNSKKGFDKPI